MLKATDRLSKIDAGSDETRSGLACAITAPDVAKTRRRTPYSFEFGDAGAEVTRLIELPGRALVFERLAEYGRRPHRDCLAEKTAYHGPQSTGICVKHRGVRFHRIRDFKLFRQYSANPSILQVPVSW